MDSAYLKEHVGQALSLGLAEVCQKKPVDPIDYLSKWLRKHVENLQDNANEKSAAEELSKQVEKAAEEQRRQDALLEEQKQIANEIMKRDLERLDQEHAQQKLETEQAKEREQSETGAPQINVAITLDDQNPSTVSPSLPSPTLAAPMGSQLVVEASDEVKNSDNEEENEPHEPESTKADPITKDSDGDVSSTVAPSSQQQEEIATSKGQVVEVSNKIDDDASVNNNCDADNLDVNVKDGQLTDSLNVDE